MATYNSDKISEGRPAITLPAQDITVFFEVTITAAFAASDIIELCKIPAFAKVSDIFLDIPDIDTGTTWQFDLGTDESATQFASNLQTGRSAGQVTNADLADAALPWHNVDTGAGNVTDEVTLRMTVDAASDATSGTIKGYCRYSMQEQYQETAPAS